jgi:F0F1-type ATP synthase epsilon subunit
MATYTEPSRNFTFLLSEGNGTISREKVTIVAGCAPATAGTVLGKITASGKYTAYDDGLTSGAEDAVAVLAETVDATADVSAVVIRRMAEVKKAELNWHASADATAKTAAYTNLLLSNIVARD